MGSLTTPAPPSRTAFESQFAKALRLWLDDLKSKEDRRSPFYKEVLARVTITSTASSSSSSAMAACNGSPQQLTAFITEQEKKYRGESWALRLLERLEPFITNLTQLMTLCTTIVQAAPFEIGIAFVGAQLVLQLATRHVVTFRRIVGIMEEIAANLECYAHITTAFAGSQEVADRLIKAYKIIINFWHRASQVLSRGCTLRYVCLYVCVEV